MRRSSAVLIVVSLLSFAHGAGAQEADDLRARIEAHYAAIHAGDTEAVVSHHLPDISIFPFNGHALMEPGWVEAAERMGAEVPFPDATVVMKHFAAQVYGDVAVATFYLDGNYGEETGIWRVSAVWVLRDGEWMEAHHHESRLSS